MKVIDLYRENKVKYSKYVILIRVGVFYESYDEDAYLLNNLFGYKIKEIVDYSRAGFPIGSYNKVISKLNMFKINYLVIDNEIIKKRFNKNKYDEYIKCDLNIDERINNIYKKLITLKNTSIINDVLGKVENVLWLKS